MRGKVWRVVLVLAVLGALAAIPASTQVLQTNSQTPSDRAGANLQLVVLVNRLELSRAQMETLRTTIGGLLAQRDVLDQKRAAFEQEMIAFNGTAEELNARLVTFNAEMKTARAAFREQVATAVDTLKETLTMKQGEILMNAFPGLMGRLDTASTQAAGAVPQAMSSGAMMKQRGQMGAMQKSGQMGTMMESGQASRARTIERASGVAAKIQSMAQRIRDRIAGRLGAAATATVPSATTVPPCPMLGTMMPSTGGADSTRGMASSSEVGNSGDFGTLTISLSGVAPMASAGAAGGEQRLLDWLARWVQVLELKLAAMS